MSRYLEITLSLLVALAVLFVTFLRQQNQTVQQSQAPILEHADAFGENVTAIEMDSFGKPKNVMITSQLIHYPYQDTTVFTNPHVIVYQKEAPPWHTTALQGKSQQGSKIIVLQGNVKIHQSADVNNVNTNTKPLTFKTSALTIYPERDFAETSAPVTVFDTKATLNALGMRAYFKEKRVEFLSQVRGIYDPQP